MITKLKAASMPLVMIISTLMLLSVAMLFSLMDSSALKTLNELQQEMDLESAINIYCRDTTLLKEYPDVEITVTKHGLYEIIEARVKEKQLSRKAILGFLPQDTTLYISDNGRPLSITGKCNISGTVYMPKSGVIYNQMQSDFFVGKKIENIQISDVELPETYQWEQEVEQEEIMIGKAMMLEDTIIRARKIVVEEGFRGTVQLYAIDTVIISENVTLKYPSGIYMKQGYIEIRDSSVVNGYIVVSDTNNLKINYKQSPKAIIRGTLFINGTAQVQGIVSGDMYVSECKLFTPEGIYSNTIYNLSVIGNKEIARPILIKNAPAERRIIKWCN